MIKLLIGKWENYQVLFRGYKDDKIIKQAFMFIFVMRLIIYYIILAYMIDFPLVQVILITILSVAMLLYLIVLRPLRKKLNMAEIVFYEVCILCVNLCVFILAVLDKQGKEELELRNSIGDGIIYLNIVFGVGSIIFLVVEMVTGLYEGYKLAKKKSKEEGTSVCVQMLTVPF